MIAIFVKGGVVQSVCSTDPDEARTRVILVDGDTDGADPEDVETVDGEPAYVSDMPVDLVTPQDGSLMWELLRLAGEVG
jgi:hypothetical protein